MANIVQLKRSSVAGKIPDTGNVVVGEPVVNLTDRVIYTKDGSDNIIKIAAGNLQALADVSNTTPTANQVLTWTGIIWSPANVESTGGGVTSVGGATGAVSNTQLLAGIIAVDGSGSNLDADLLDGIDSTAFLRSDIDDTAASNLTITGDVQAGAYFDNSNRRLLIKDAAGNVVWGN